MKGSHSQACRGMPAVRVFHTGGSGGTVPSGGLQRAEVSSEATECPLPGEAVLSLAWLLMTVAPWGTPARIGVALSGHTLLY